MHFGWKNLGAPEPVHFRGELQARCLTCLLSECIVTRLGSDLWGIYNQLCSALIKCGNWEKRPHTGTRVQIFHPYFSQSSSLTASNIKVKTKVIIIKTSQRSTIWTIVTDSTNYKPRVGTTSLSHRVFPSPPSFESTTSSHDHTTHHEMTRRKAGRVSIKVRSGRKSRYDWTGIRTCWDPSSILPFPDLNLVVLQRLQRQNTAKHRSERREHEEDKQVVANCRKSLFPNLATAGLYEQIRGKENEISTAWIGPLEISSCRIFALIHLSMSNWGGKQVISGAYERPVDLWIADPRSFHWRKIGYRKSKTSKDNKMKQESQLRVNRASSRLKSSSHPSYALTLVAPQRIKQYISSSWNRSHVWQAKYSTTHLDSS